MNTPKTPRAKSPVPSSILSARRFRRHGKLAMAAFAGVSALAGGMAEAVTTFYPSYTSTTDLTQSGAYLSGGTLGSPNGTTAQISFNTSADASHTWTASSALSVGSLWADDGSANTIVISAGTINLSSSSTSTASALAVSTTNMVISGGTVNLTGSTQSIFTQGAGVLTIYDTLNTSAFTEITGGGTTNIDGTWTLGANAQIDYVTVSGAGAVTVPSGITVDMGTGSGITSTVTVQSSGTFTINSGGTLVDLAGNLTGNTGTLIISGGGTVSLAAGSKIDLFNSSNYGPTVDLKSGGTLNLGTQLSGTGTVVLAASAGTLNFSGGTLALTASLSDLINPTYSAGYVLNVGGTGGAVINTNGYNLGISENLNHSSTVTTDGGVTVFGSGTVTLSGTNSFNGPTKVTSGGTLRTSNLSSTSVTIGNGSANSGTLAVGTNATSTSTLASTGATYTLTGGGALDININNATGTAGSSSGNDLITAASMSTTNTGSNPFTINLLAVGGATANFSPATPYTWTIATFTAGSSNISAGTVLATASSTGAPVTSGAFSLNTTNFVSANSTESGSSSFSLELVDNSGTDSLEILYSATPEPGTALLALGGVAPLLMARRRRREQPKN